MSAPAANTFGSAAGPQRGPVPKPRGFWGMVLKETLTKWGARVGLVWVVILAMLGCFGPLIANSNPYVARWADGRVTSPLWESLSYVDVALAAGAAMALFGLALRLRVSVLVVCVTATTLAGGAVGAIKGMPISIVYESYREGLASGKLISVVNAPIPYSPSDRSRDSTVARDRPPTWADSDRATAPGYHWLGTEREGADVASKLIAASRTALAIGFIATTISSLIGIVIGGLMGYYAGWVDILGMRAIEMFEAIPRLMLLLAMAAIFGADIWFIMVIIGLTSWMGIARFIRAEFLRLRKQDFVQAAVALGLPSRSIIFRHLLPNGLTPVLVSMSFGVAGAILMESTLTFLGISKPDQPSWGQLLDQARAGGQFLWWIATFPGLMIFLTVFSYTLIGEALRDALDPKLKKRE